MIVWTLQQVILYKPWHQDCAPCQNVSYMFCIWWYLQSLHSWCHSLVSQPLHCNSGESWPLTFDPLPNNLLYQLGWILSITPVSYIMAVYFYNHTKVSQKVACHCNTSILRPHNLWHTSTNNILAAALLAPIGQPYNVVILKCRSTTFAWLSAYAHWLQTHRQTP